MRILRNWIRTCPYRKLMMPPLPQTNFTDTRIQGQPQMRHRNFCRSLATMPMIR